MFQFFSDGLVLDKHEEEWRKVRQLVLCSHFLWTETFPAGDSRGSSKAGKSLLASLRNVRKLSKLTKPWNYWIHYIHTVIKAGVNCLGAEAPACCNCHATYAGAWWTHCLRATNKCMSTPVSITKICKQINTHIPHQYRLKIGKQRWFQGPELGTQGWTNIWASQPCPSLLTPSMVVLCWGLR